VEAARALHVSAFPPELPAALDDPVEIREHDWQAFSRLGQMNDHWQRPGWTPGRRSYHWMLTVPDGAADVRGLAATCQAAIARPELDPVPLDGLHLTVGRIGFTDEVTADTATAVAGEASAECHDLGPIELLVGPLAGSRGALRFSVSPWLPLMALHQRLTDATRRVLGSRSVMDTDRFRPHLSIAYANTTVSVASLIPKMEHLRSIPPVAMTVASAALVELYREGSSYRYSEMHSTSLGS
jgi:2'-5' RNA ligase